MGSNKQHKDRLFKFVFGNEDHKEWTLSLYNALTGSNWTDPGDLEFNTLEDAVYMGMKNDVSFIIAFILSIWEHQSSYNANLPLRIFLYLAHVIEKYLAGNKAYRYGTKLVKLPTPKCICFYNGLQEQPDEVVLKLSDAFDSDNIEPDVELKVRMININFGHNEALMGKCRPLYEYACFIEAIRTHQKTAADLETAIDIAVEEMPADFLLKKFLVVHRAEVKGMFLTEWDDDEADYYRRLEAREEGREEGRLEGREEGRVEGREEGRVEGREEGISEDRARLASDMLRNGESLDKIKLYSMLAEEVILNLAKSLGVAVM